jgi:hypothetical protein
MKAHTLGLLLEEIGERMAVPTDVAMEVYARDGGVCRVGGMPVAGERGFGWSIHHRLPRGMGGIGKKAADSELLDYLLLVCGHGTAGCHGWLEQHRLVARDLGLILPRTTPPTDPASVPVRPRMNPCDRRYIP